MTGDVRPTRALRADLRRLIRGLGVLRARYPGLGLGVSQCHTLLELEEGTRSLGELGAELRIDASSASRNLATLERHGYVRHDRDPADPRRKLFRLTRGGRDKTRAVHRHGDRVMQRAFEYLTPAEQSAVRASLGALASAVERSQDPRVEVRRSRRRDNPAIAGVIRCVLAELGMTGPDTGFEEPATFEIHDVYARADGAYFVACLDGVVEGGGGILPHTSEVCELKNLYFTPALRGAGHARCLVNRALGFARERGYREVFLETHSGWEAAAALYRRFGFEPCRKPAFYAGHDVCDRYFSLRLSQPAGCAG